MCAVLHKITFARSACGAETTNANASCDRSLPLDSESPPFGSDRGELLAPVSLLGPLALLILSVVFIYFILLL